MRPDRFEAFAAGQLAELDAVARSAALRDIGDTAHPYGVAVQVAAGAEFRWQITAQSAPGEAYDRPEAPVEGEPAPAVAAPQPAGAWGPADAETLLAHALTVPGPALAAHVARHDPARALREVEAKRRIIECHELWVAANGDTICGRCGREHVDGRPGGHFPCQTLRLLAAVYADHPDYRQEWRP